MKLSLRCIAWTALSLLTPCLAIAVSNDFVTISEGRFMNGPRNYRYVGTNFWYGAILGSQGRGGDRSRLGRELDLLQANGIDNIRVLVGADGPEGEPSHVMPSLQTAPGVYNDTILDGLDYLMSELERRDMKAVLFLNNAWEWSGGYGTYLEWATGQKTPNPAIDGYDKYMSYVSRFVKNEKAKELAANHVRNIVTRTNRYTGRPYAESPAVMSWQIANEPRAFASDPDTKRAFADWISSQAALIKSLDPNHLVSTGSEGSHGCEQDIELWETIHKDPNIDYAIMHLWPYNWGWVNERNITDNVRNACDNADIYINEHSTRARAMGKPLVIEEFGYPRDGFVYSPGSPTLGRDTFYDHIFSLVEQNDNIGGCNFWSWGGYAQPRHDFWEPWDDYTGDPAQEAQGLNSVFAKDSTTLEIIKKANIRLNQPITDGKIETCVGALKLTAVPNHNWWWNTSEQPRVAITAADTTGNGAVHSFKVTVKGDRTDAPIFYSENIEVCLQGAEPSTFEVMPDLTQPGFYRVEMSEGDQSLISFNIGIEPELILSKPDAQPDIQEFWKKALAELAQVPLDATMVEMPEKSGEKRKIYFCQYLSLDNDTVSGYLALPVKEGKYPAIIYYNGYNGEPWDIDPDGLPDWIEFQHWVRGQGPNKPYNRYDDYVQYHLEDPEKYYYRGAFMDAVRTLDFISSLPQTDTDNIFAEGGSQGGAFTFVAAALDPKHRLRGIAPYIPFLSDFPDYFEIVGWPGDVVRQKAAEIGLQSDILYKNLTYFDIKNLTPMITVPVLMGAGLQDPVCPPHTNFSGYNNLGSTDKQFVIYPLCGHTVDYADWNPRRINFFKRLMK